MAPTLYFPGVSAPGDEPDSSVLAVADEMQLRQEWRTPRGFLAAISREFKIDIDVSASAQNCAVPLYWSSDQNGLERPWFMFPLENDQDVHGPRVAWCNPGFRDLGSWVAKAVREVSQNQGCVALVMGTAAPSTAWWAAALNAGAEIRLLAPRVQFIAPPGIKQSSNARENALVVIRSPVGGNDRERARREHIWTWRWDAEAVLTNREEP